MAGTSANSDPSVRLIVLGPIVQKVTGRSLDKVLRTRLTGPLSLRDTGFTPVTWLSPANRAPTKACPRSTPNDRSGPRRTGGASCWTSRGSWDAWASAWTFGHTGFTGTSLLVHPGLRLVLVLLTNRAHPNWSWANPDPTRVAVANVLADALL